MKKIALAVLMMGLAQVCRASDVVYSTWMVNGALASTQSFVLDLNANRIDQASVQINYSSATQAAITFYDGRPATGTITFNLTSLTTAYATNNITVVSTQGMVNNFIYFNGNPINLNNYVSRTASDTAANLVAYFGSNYSDILTATNNTTGTVIYATATTAGLAYNSYTLISSTPTALTVSKLNFSGGQDNAAITIAGISLLANKDWYPGATTTTAATALSNAINANGALKALIAATTGANVIYTTATAIGNSGNYYTLATSTPSAVSVSSAVMSNGLDSDIVLNYSTMTYAFPGSSIFGFPGSQYRIPTNSIVKNNSLGTAWPVLFKTVSGTAPTPLVTNTTYYASNVTPQSFKLIDTATGALAGLYLTISTQAQAGGGSFTITGSSPTGTFTMRLMESNDGVNYTQSFYSVVNSTQPCLISFAPPQTTAYSFWNLGDLYSRFLKFQFDGPGTNFGAVNAQVLINGKKSSTSSY